MCLYRKKIFLFRTSGPISIKLYTNNPWVKGIINCSNKWTDTLQRGYNYKNTKWVGVIQDLLLKNHLARISHIYMNAF
jgi:hypothetical protein